MFASTYTFVINTAPDFDGVFIRAGVFELDTSRVGGPVKICTSYRIQFVYSNGMTKNLCNGTEVESLPELVGQDFVTVQIEIRPSSYYSRNRLNSYNYKYDSRPLVGSTGRTIPITSVGAISFTSYKDCSGKESEQIAHNLRANISSAGNEGKVKRPVRATTTDLRSCSSYSESKCIHSKLFCNGDINCGLPILNYLLTGKIHESGYDERGENCKESHVWKQKAETTYRSNSYPSYSDSTTPTKSSSLSTMVIIITIGVILSVLGVCAKACTARNSSWQSEATHHDEPEASEPLRRYPRPN